MNERIIATLQIVASVAWLILIASAPFCQGEEPVPLVGVDRDGKVHNAPADWPARAGAWNGKDARYNAKTQKLVFETFRDDIVGGSVKPEAGRIKA